MGRFTLAWLDSDGDRAQVSYQTPDAAGDGSDYSALLAAQNALRDAIAATQLTPALISQGHETNREDNIVSAPADSFNQTSIRWLIEYTVDGLSGVYTDPIPCANFSLGTPSGGVTILDLGSGVGAALKAAFEAAVNVEKGIDAGGTGAVTVTRIYGDRT